MATTTKITEIKPYEIKPSELEQILTYMLAMRPAPTIFIWGGPGIGKTQIVNQVARALSYDLIPFRAAYREPTDIKGFPHIETIEHVDQDGNVTTEKITAYARPKWLPVKGSIKKPKIIFADEVNRAPILTQNTLLELFEERCIEEFKLDDNVAIIAACNREQDGGGVQRMPQALANRAFHFYLIPDADDFYDWAAKNDFYPPLFAFLKARADCLYSFSADSKSFPTPRMWAKLSDCWKLNPPKNVMRHQAIGAVGYEVANECLSYIETLGMLPTMENILLNPKTAVVPDSASALYAVARTLGRNLTVDNFDAARIYLNRCPGEYRVYAIQDAMQRDPSINWAKGFAEFTIKDKALLSG